MSADYLENTVGGLIRQIMLGAKRATKYVSPTLVYKATARHRLRRGARTVEMVVTIGKPNYAESRFIAVAKKAGEPFPVKKVQVKAWRKGKK